MFYCDPCGQKNSWPRDFWSPLSRGTCECCGNVATCYDVPSACLPSPKEGAITEDSRRQFWLAELDKYGNPKLIDGSHSTREGAEKAAHLIRSMRLPSANSRLAVADVTLTELDGGVSLTESEKESVETINSVMDWNTRNDKEQADE